MTYAPLKFGSLLLVSLSLCAAAVADETPYSTNLTGNLGLNTIPNARLDQTGTIRAGLSTLDPYADAWIGIQVAEPLSVVIRQSAEISSLREEAKNLYPALDLKLRLLEETAARPELSLGLQSAFGHKRKAGEYLVLSKRYGDFDFTGGLGWGAMGQNTTFRNPVSFLGGKFDKNRADDGDLPNKHSNWFTGEDTGLFGGIEYFTPLDGLSVKLDYSPYRYNAESAEGNFNTPAPYSLGLNYKPAPWIDLGLAAQGTDKIMGRISVQGLLQNWRNQNAQQKTKNPLRPYRTGLNLPAQMELSAARDSIYLFDAQSDGTTSGANLFLQNNLSAPRQIGQAAIHIANHAGAQTERIEITPMILNLRGPKVHLMRRDLETALAKNEGSAEEIWQKTSFDTAVQPQNFTQITRPQEYGYGLNSFGFTLDNQLSLAEEDSGILYRSALLIKHQVPKFFGFLDNFTSLRLNLKNNLSGLSTVRAYSTTARGDAESFAERGVALDTLFTSYTHSFRPDLHLAMLGGYLEEMYAGLGGEILYRPFESRFSFGAESWLALKRDPFTPLNAGLNTENVLTGHLNAWYELPVWNSALHASIGRYLAQDVGGSLGLEKNFTNGAKLETYITLTDRNDFDAFGGTTNIINGLRLSLPLGGFKYAPQNADIRMRAEPIGRINGQRLENPLPLHNLTEPFTLKHMQDHWSDITPE